MPDVGNARLQHSLPPIWIRPISLRAGYRADTHICQLHQGIAFGVVHFHFFELVPQHTTQVTIECPLKVTATASVYSNASSVERAVIVCHQRSDEKIIEAACIVAKMRAVQHFLTHQHCANRERTIGHALEKSIAHMSTRLAELEFGLMPQLKSQFRDCTFGGSGILPTGEHNHSDPKNRI